MDKETRDKTISELQEKFHKLEDEARNIQEEIDKLDNERECDICGSVHSRWNLDGTIGITDFRETGFSPVIIDNKEINCICSSCFIKRMEKNK